MLRWSEDSLSRNQWEDTALYAGGGATAAVAMMGTKEVWIGSDKEEVGCFMGNRIVLGARDPL